MENRTPNVAGRQGGFRRAGRSTTSKVMLFISRGEASAGSTDIWNNEYMSKLSEVTGYGTALDADLQVMQYNYYIALFNLIFLQVFIYQALRPKN
jgi:hypothetical protein